MDHPSGNLLLCSQKGEQMILFLPCPPPASVACSSFSRQFKKEVMLAGCVRHRKRQRNQAPCHQPLTSAGGMWEKAKPNPSQIKLACKRPSFLRNFWIKYWLQPARFHWKWLCQLVLNNSLSCICFLCCFPLSVDFPVDAGKLNLLLNTFLLLLTWQTWGFVSDWKQDGWLCIAAACSRMAGGRRWLLLSCSRQNQCLLWVFWMPTTHSCSSPCYSSCYFSSAVGVPRYSLWNKPALTALGFLCK